MIGIHCCGKSVMLELIERELTEFGVSPTQFVSINFEDKSCASCHTFQALQIHPEWSGREAGNRRSSDRSVSYKSPFKHKKAVVDLKIFSSSITAFCIRFSRNDAQFKEDG